MPKNREVYVCLESVCSFFTNNTSSERVQLSKKLPQRITGTIDCTHPPQSRKVEIQLDGTKHKPGRVILCAICQGCSDVPAGFVSLTGGVLVKK